MEEQEKLLGPRRPQCEERDNISDDDEWTDSSCSSYYSDSDSSAPEWESLIEDSGQLLFIDCYPVVTQTNNEPEQKSSFSKTHLRKSTRSKFLRLIRRRESKRKSKKYTKHTENIDVGSANKVTFHDQQEGEIKEVILNIDQDLIYKTGRKTSLVETLLGITVSTLSDGSRVMVAGFTQDGEAKNERNIKIGDWLKRINGIEVSIQNLNSVLEQMSSGDEIVLELQRVAGVEVTKDPPANELSNQSKFVQQLTTFNTEEEQQLSTILCQYPIGILYIDTSHLTESGPEYEGIIYCYPRPLEKNKLCASRGIFITLNHLLMDITKEQTKMTSVSCNGKLSHIIYTSYGKKLLLFLLPDNRSSANETMLLKNELVRMLEFMYQSVERCFETSTFKNELDHFFSRFFTRILTSGLWSNAEQHVDIKDLPVKANSLAPAQFEHILPGGQMLPMPIEAQMQIDDALNELEASDYREWNEDPLECQRLFTILGCALYHSGILLATHFPHGDLIDVHLYCRQQGLLHLSRYEPVRCMVLWREVYPTSCNRGLLVANTQTQMKFPESRRYLLIVGSGKDMLAVIMEAGGCTEPAEDCIGPDAFYVEEVQATLAHLQELGIPQLADRYLSKLPPQVTIPEANIVKKKPDLLNSIYFSKSSPNLNKDSSLNQKKTEVTSILKRRGSDQALVNNSASAYSLPDDSFELNSEDSTSQGGYSERSEISDEPVLGRRAIRERRAYESDGEESDYDDFGEGSQITCSSYDLSEIRQSLLADTAETLPTSLTAGNQNVLFHYVEYDAISGVILAPIDTNKSESKTLEFVLKNFRGTCQNIHKLFQNTLRFKNMPSQDMSKSIINKSLIAIKEHGVLLECCYKDETIKKNVKLRFWVVGRLFFTPDPKELYVCYQDTVPQNLVEIAFKLGINQST